ncbi:hypothetical protein EBZ39_00220 [bacterium]|nr:hypothetical protein [bacterium]
MAIAITNLDELAPEKIDAMFTTLSQLMQERHPEIELTRGVFHDLVLYFSSVLNATMQENIDRVRQSNSLQQIKNNPSIADDTIVDQVLSNYNLTRDAGTAATGLATLIMPFAASVTFPQAVNLTANDIVFNPTQSFQILPPGSVAVTAAERVMSPVGDGTFIATVPVIAAEVGTAGNIVRGTPLVPNFMPTADFVNGRDPATNEDYISRLAPALAAKTIGGRQSYIATIRSQTPFDTISHISVLGAGDPEQRRDQHGLFPISGGGKADIYLQSHGYAQTREYFLEATYVGPAVIGTRWQITFDRDLSPALYEVLRIAKPQDFTNTGYQIVNEIRGVDFSNLDFVPSIKYLHESAYTRYQTLTIQFDDTDTPAINLTPNQSKATYSVQTSSLPYVAEVQDFLTDRDRRSRTTDVLVRAAIPCFTKISFQIRKDANDADPDFSAIQKAVSEKVATVGFTGQLHASLIAATVQQLLTGKQAIGSIDMFGRIRKPDGQNVYVRDNTLLQIPNNPEHLITGRTTAFLTRPEDVSITSVTAGFVG